LDGTLGLEGSDCAVDIVGHDITAVEQAGSHVLSITWITLDHLVVGLEARVGDLLDRVGLMRSLGSRDDGSVCNQGEVDTWVGNQVGLELVQINVKGAIESERGGDGRDDCNMSALMPKHSAIRPTLSDETVQVLVVGTLDSEVAAADVVDGLVVDHEAAVRVLESGVSSEDRVVGLNHRGSDLRSGVDAKLELALLAIVDRETLHQQGAEAGSSTTTEGVEDKEALKTSAVVCNAADLVEHLIDEFLADGVVTTSIVVGSILLASDHVFGVEETAVSTGADFINDIGFKVAVDGAWHVLALT
jgi:hypothetical protein